MYYYGLYLFAIALVIMMGQLAFALYQVASLFICREQGPPEGVSRQHAGQRV